MSNIADFNKAKDQAENLLDQAKITDFPVPLENIVGRFGYRIVETELQAGMAGLIDPRKKLIVTNQGDPAHRKAFTIAHELGHLILHADEIEDNPEMSLMFRKPLASKDYDYREQEANCFAANLLVPMQMLKGVMKFNPMITTRELSDLFGVSPEVIKYRLTELEENNIN